jgi:hypothetical protein
MAVFLAISGASNVAFAVYELEPNNPIATPQEMAVGSSGGAEINGVLGVLSGPATNDVDFYTFEGREGDVVTIDIDGGIKPNGSGLRNFDSYLAIIGPGPTFQKLRENDNVTTQTFDSGSLSRLDALIINFRLPATGTYTVGVSSFPRFFELYGGTVMPGPLGPMSNGSYTLLVSGVSPPVQQINIDIKPGSGALAPINPKSKGKIPVALLSNAEFNALDANRQSITFGATGNEASLHHCGNDGEDVNGDGLADLVCHFENQAANFDYESLEGILRGQTADGRQFEGRGLLKVVPGKRQ